MGKIQSGIPTLLPFLCLYDANQDIDQLKQRAKGLLLLGTNDRQHLEKF